MLEETLDYVKNHPCFVTGQQGSIISLCPTTEPFKSGESAYLIMLILEAFLQLGNPVQISTKESIPVEIFQLAQQRCISERQVYFNISTSCISKAPIIEPKASPLKIRFENFEAIKAYDKLTSCIYIKPFTLETLKDLEQYIDIINRYKPDVACVGIDFKKATILEKPCDLLYHSKEVVDKALDLNLESRILFVRNQIEKRASIPVFHSSTCIISNYLNYKTNGNIMSVAPSLCRRCNGCNTISEENYDR